MDLNIFLKVYVGVRAFRGRQRALKGFTEEILVLFCIEGCQNGASAEPHFSK